MLLKEIREAAGITQVGMAHRCGVSKQHIMRIEQGVYAKLNDAIAEAYAELTPDYAGLTAYQLICQYSIEVENRREALKYEIAEHVLKQGGWTNAPVEFSEFRKFIGYESRIGFCKALACHPSTVLNYEKGKARRLPADVSNALRSVGVPKSLLELIKPKRAINGND